MSNGVSIEISLQCKENVEQKLQQSPKKQTHTQMCTCGPSWGSRAPAEKPWSRAVVPNLCAAKRCHEAEITSNFFFYFYIYPPDSQESDRGAIQSKIHSKIQKKNISNYKEKVGQNGS